MKYSEDQRKAQQRRKRAAAQRRFYYTNKPNGRKSYNSNLVTLLGTNYKNNNR